MIRFGSFAEFVIAIVILRYFRISFLDIQFQTLIQFCGLLKLNVVEKGCKFRDDANEPFSINSFTSGEIFLQLGKTSNNSLKSL